MHEDEPDRTTLRGILPIRVHGEDGAASGTRQQVRDQKDAHHRKASDIFRLWTALRFFAYGPGVSEGPDRHYHIAIFQLQALAAHDPELRDRFTRDFHYMVDLTMAIIEDGVQDGTFQAVDSEETAVYLIATIVGARNAGLTFEVDFVRESVMAHVKQYVDEMLVAWPFGDGRNLSVTVVHPISEFGETPLFYRVRK